MEPKSISITDYVEQTTNIRFGRIGYEAYRKRMIPTWHLQPPFDSLSGAEREAWTDAATAIGQAVLAESHAEAKEAVIAAAVAFDAKYRSARNGSEREALREAVKKLKEVQG